MLNKILNQAYLSGKEKTDMGNVATYIPELGKANPDDLGICVYTKYGQKIFVGDTSTRFSIQSVSKIISLAITLEKLGKEKVFEYVGMEPSGDAFNSLLKLEKTDSTPHNPFVNAGAIVVASYMLNLMSFEEALQIVKKLCMDDEIEMDENIYRSEMDNLSRNRSIAYLLDSKGYIGADVEKTLDFYVRMCSLKVTAESLANLGLVLACKGVNPATGERLLSEETVKMVNTIMLTCGMYDGAGEFAVKVGLPSKSGVGGGIISVVKDNMGIGIYGPSLDKKGNSIAGISILEYVSEHMNLHMFE